MSNLNPPSFAKPGGIERSLGHINRSAVPAFQEREIKPVPENRKKSQQARTLRPISPLDGTMRYVSPDSKQVYSPIGVIWIRTIRPSQKGDGKIVERWSQFDSIGNVRHTLNENIADAYDEGGREHENRLTFIRHMNSLARRLQTGPITDQELELLYQQTMEVAFRTRYLTSLLPDRRKTGTQVLKAATKDSRGQTNQPASRMIIGQERDDVTQDLLLDEVKLNRNRERVVVVDAVISFQESVLGAVGARSDLLSRMRIGTGLFDSKLDGYLVDIQNMLSSKVITVKPYTDAAAKILYLLFAENNTSQTYELAKDIGLQEAMEFTKGFVPFERLTDAQKQERIRLFSRIVGAAIEKRVADQNPLPMDQALASIRPKPKRKEDLFWEEVDKLRF